MNDVDVVTTKKNTRENIESYSEDWQELHDKICLYRNALQSWLDCREVLISDAMRASIKRTVISRKGEANDAMTYIDCFESFLGEKLFKNLCDTKKAGIKEAWQQLGDRGIIILGSVNKNRYAYLSMSKNIPEYWRNVQQDSLKRRKSSKSVQEGRPDVYTPMYICLDLLGG